MGKPVAGWWRWGAALAGRAARPPPPARLPCTFTAAHKPMHSTPLLSVRTPVKIPLHFNACRWEVRKCEKPRYTLLKTIGQRRGWFGKVAPAAEVSMGELASNPGSQAFGKPARLLEGASMN